MYTSYVGQHRPQRHPRVLITEVGLTGVALP
jgi:hypothetical protein